MRGSLCSFSLLNNWATITCYPWIHQRLSQRNPSCSYRFLKNLFCVHEECALGYISEFNFENSKCNASTIQIKWMKLFRISTEILLKLNLEFRLILCRISSEILSNFYLDAVELRLRVCWFSTDILSNLDRDSVEFWMRFYRISTKILLNLDWDSVESRLRFYRSRWGFFRFSTEILPNLDWDSVELRLRLYRIST